jgi:glutathione synthase
MGLKIAIQADPIAKLNKDFDSTLMLAEEALSRGAEVFYFQPENLSIHSHDGVMARGNFLSLSSSGIVELQSSDRAGVLENLAGYSFVLMRQDPPYNMPYITGTYILEQLPATTRVLNNPKSVRNLPEKIAPLSFIDETIETLISLDVMEVQKFADKHGKIVAKPLFWFGAYGVMLLERNDSNLPSLVEWHKTNGAVPLVFQKFIPEVKHSEKRILIIDGEIVGFFNRVPPEHSIRSNTRSGGNYKATELTDAERAIAIKVANFLKQNDVFFAGIDLIGGYLNEINITCPTGFRIAQNLTGANLAATYWDALLN